MKDLDDLENEGFVIYGGDTHKKQAKGEPAVADTKIVVVDTKEVLHAVAATNAIVKAGMDNSNAQLKLVVAELVSHMPKKPESFTLDIKRDQRGFMTSIDVKIGK